MRLFLRKRSVCLSGHRTSIALEGEFWEILDDMAVREGQSLAALIGRIDRERVPEQPLASSLRLAVLRHALERDGRSPTGLAHEQNA